MYPLLFAALVPFVCGNPFPAAAATKPICSTVNKCLSASPAQSASATAYCSSYLNIPVSTVTTTKTTGKASTTTVTSTISKTTKGPATTTTVTSTITSSHTVTDISTATKTSTISTTTIVAGKCTLPSPGAKKRAAAGSCIASYSAGPTRSSACACLSISPATTTTTITTTNGAVVTSTAKVTTTVTSQPTKTVTTTVTTDRTIHISGIPTTTTVTTTETSTETRGRAVPTNFYFADDIDYQFASYFYPPQGFGAVSFAYPSTNGALLASLHDSGRLQDVNNPDRFASQPLAPYSNPYNVIFTDQVNPNDGNEPTDWVYCFINTANDLCRLYCLNPQDPQNGDINSFSDGYPGDNYWYLGDPHDGWTEFSIYVVDADN